jgi:hypothetical protein
MITPHDEFLIELNDTNTAEAIWNALPFDAYTNTWGEEIYFEIPVRMKLEHSKKVMEIGEVAYWPDGNALCLFYGPTPVSDGESPVAISPVTPVGRVLGDPKNLRRVGDRMKVTLDRF